MMAAPAATRRPAPPPAAAPGRRRRGRGVTRRAFLRNAWLAGLVPLLATFTGASLAFLWPNLRGGFGSEVEVDTEAEVRGFIEGNKAPYVYPSARLYVVAYDPALDPDGQYAEVTGGSVLMALYHKCPHLGCRVPWCQTSQWFECPCHGSRYNRWGEYQAGPAPRGMDRFPVRVEAGRVLVNTGAVVTGPARGSGTLDQPKEGPSCI